MKILNSISRRFLSVGPHSSSGRTDWLLKLLGLSGEALPRIREEVRGMIWEESLKTGDAPFENGAPIGDIHHRLSSRLIKRCAIKSAAMGGVTSTPAVLPVIGTLGTIIAGTTTDFIYLIRKQIELCYAISAVYDTAIDEEELKAITLALLGFSGTGQMVKEIAAGTLKNIVDATTARYLKRGLTTAAAEVAVKITPRFLGRAYKLIPLVSIPLSASINIASTMMVGNHARKYFATEFTTEPHGTSQIVFWNRHKKIKE